VLLFLIGAAYAIPIQLLGSILTGELLAIPIVTVAFMYRPRFSLSTQGVIIALSVITFLSYVVSDIYRESAPENYLRGWARCGFMIVNLQAFYLLSAGKLKNLHLLLCGWATGYFILAIIEFGDFSNHAWKFGYSFPFAIAAQSLASAGGVTTQVLVSLTTAIINFTMDYRSFSAFLLLVAIFIPARGRISKLIYCTAIALPITYAFSYMGYQYWIDKNPEMASRHIESNSERAATLEMGFDYIMASPYIGYGSWPYDPYFTKTAFAIAKSKGSIRGYDQESHGTIAAHSQILQAWIEGGILATLFFAYMLFHLTSGLMYYLRYPSLPFFSVFAFILIDVIVELIVSPLGIVARTLIPVASAAAVILRQSSTEIQNQFGD